MDSAEKNSAFDKRLKRQVIGKPHRFLAVVPLGFEKTFVREMDFLRRESVENQGTSSLDIKIAGDGKVEFTAKLVDAWKVVAYSRIANRILMHIADFKAENFRELEKKAAEVPWELYLDESSTDVHVTCKHSRLYHSDAVAERLQKVIEGGSLPLAAAPAGSSATPSAGAPRNAPKSEASDLAPHTSSLYVTLIDDRCTLWLDLAGEELYKRGHERFVNDAPLKETIAAGMLYETIRMVSFSLTSKGEARPHTSKPDTSGDLITLIDPMAGSGTFSLEAAYMANGLIPGKCRDFALKHQPAFKPATWNHIVNSANANPNPSLRRNNDSELSLQRNDNSMLSLRRNEVTAAISSTIHKIITSDISEKAVGIITHNVECCPLANIAPSTAAPTISPQLRDFFSYTAKEIADLCGESAPVIVLNPPYGKRLDFDAPKLYTQIGKKFTELARELAPLGKQLTVAILAPKDDSRPGSKYTCTANLLHECPALDPQQNSDAKCIATSHGGLSLNAIIARI